MFNSPLFTHHYFDVFECLSLNLCIFSTSWCGGIILTILPFVHFMFVVILFCAKDAFPYARKYFSCIQPSVFSCEIVLARVARYSLTWLNVHLCEETFPCMKECFLT